LRFANSSISHNSRQFEKVLRPIRKGNIKPEVYYALDPADQADFVTSKIDEFIKSGVRPPEIAVLYRNHAHSMELQMSLTRLKIPFEVRSGLKFFEQAHVKDIMAYLKIITNPKDQIAWARILKIYEGIGEKTAQKIIRNLSAIDFDLLKLNSKDMTRIISPSVKNSWDNLTRLLLKINSVHVKRSCYKAINTIMDEFYERYLKGKYPNAIERIEDIRRVAEYARDFDSVEQFLADMTLLTNVPGEEVRSRKDRVILSTVHQAKGLEWDVVFIIWLIEKQFPYSRSISKGQRAIEEERRLFYVGCTRARDRLLLVCPSYNKGWYEETPSRFIKEVETTCYRKL
jgi:DNA helicase-2/ATP-dependent DNA helicase PcrA